MTWTDLIVGLVIAVGLAGIVIPMLPGSVLVLIAIGAWAAETGEARSWIVFAVCAALIAIGSVVKYLVPGRRLKQSGIPNSTLLFGGVLAIVGFFVIPVVGVFVGFVLGIYLAELQRTGRENAWPATKEALKGVGLGILIELIAACTAAIVWFAAVLVW